MAIYKSKYTGDELEKALDNAQVQPNLSQNDPTAPDYVKNRTHYEGLQVVDIAPEQEVTFVDGTAKIADFKDPCYDLHIVDDPGTIKATLQINGEIIEGEITYYYACGGLFGAYTLGHGTISLGDGAKVQDGNTVAIRLYCEAVAVKELDYKYLPKTFTENEKVELRNAIGAADYSEVNAKWLRTIWGGEESITLGNFGHAHGGNRPICIPVEGCYQNIFIVSLKLEGLGDTPRIVNKTAIFSKEADYIDGCLVFSGPIDDSGLIYFVTIDQAGDVLSINGWAEGSGVDYLNNGTLTALLVQGCF